MLYFFLKMDPFLTLQVHARNGGSADVLEVPETEGTTKCRLLPGDLQRNSRETETYTQLY
jgi:hypothetical protein